MSYWTPEPDELGLSSTVADVQSAEVDEELGPACPDCGWRRGWHRPATTVGAVEVAACPRWVPGAETGAHLKDEGGASEP